MRSAVLIFLSDHSGPGAAELGIARHFADGEQILS